jgi:hypothetical protein
MLNLLMSFAFLFFHHSSFIHSFITLHIAFVFHVAAVHVQPLLAARGPAQWRMTMRRLSLSVE